MQIDLYQIVENTQNWATNIMQVNKAFLSMTDCHQKLNQAASVVHLELLQTSVVNRTFKMFFWGTFQAWLAVHLLK